MIIFIHHKMLKIIQTKRKQTLRSKATVYVSKNKVRLFYNCAYLGLWWWRVVVESRVCNSDTYDAVKWNKTRAGGFDLQPCPAPRTGTGNQRSSPSLFLFFFHGINLHFVP